MTTEVIKPDTTQVKRLLYITHVYIEDLFGYFTYSLPDNSFYNSFDKLMILYGDNGSGKTTILKLIFNLLSDKRNGGHRTYLASTKFSKVCVKLTDSVEIGAYRTKEALTGSYTYYATIDGITHEVFIKTDADCKIRMQDDEKDSIQLEQVLKAIESLNLSLYFLSDDRKSMSNSGIYDENYRHDFYDIRFVGDIELSQHTRKILARERYLQTQKEQGSSIEIEDALKSLTQWIKNKIIYFSNIGETNNQSIYTNLITSVSNSTQNKKVRTKEDLIKTIEDLAKKIGEYSRLGLVSPFDYKEIYDSVESVSNIETVNFINNILEPFIEGSNAKLAALEHIKNLLNTFLQSVNSYFSNKRISFNLNAGFDIEYTNGDDLSFNSLSSGEKQLLLLFINTITATDDATIFIIDEPEISLNIKWQRTLLKTLLSFSINSPVQFIIATHSVELLTSNSKRVVKLENKTVSVHA